MAEPGNDPIADYFEAIDRVPRLSDSEQTELVRTITAGGDEALAANTKLIEASLYMIPPIAHWYEGKGIAFLDLVQEGNVGLIRAVARFETDAGSFSRFAAECIEDAIVEVVRGH